MTEAAKNWFIALSRREQVLVGIAAVLAAGVIGFFLIYRPIYGLATDAKRSFYEATMQAGRIDAHLCHFDVRLDALTLNGAPRRGEVAGGGQAQRAVAAALQRDDGLHRALAEGGDAEHHGPDSQRCAEQQQRG